MKKILIALIMLAVCLALFYKQLPKGEFSHKVAEKITYTCFLKNNCDFDFMLTQFDTKLSFKWDKLYIFPNSLGAGEYGTFLINKDRGFFEAIQLVFVFNDKPIHEEYSSVVSDGIEFNDLKYAINYKNDVKGYYICYKNSVFQMKYTDKIFITPKGCDFIYSINGDKERELIESWSIVKKL